MECIQVALECLKNEVVVEKVMKERNGKIKNLHCNREGTSRSPHTRIKVEGIVPTLTIGCTSFLQVMTVHLASSHSQTQPKPSSSCAQRWPLEGA